MKLEAVLAGVRPRSAVPPSLWSAEIAGLDYDSRRIQPGYLFFAFPGSKVDGRQFASAAIKQGALAVCSELPAPAGFEAPWIEVEHGRKALARAARNFYGAPDERLGITGITGTNGKTTTAFLTDAVLNLAGKTTALVGTIEYRLAGQVRKAVNTTPESLDLYRLFDELRRLGGTHATMEVSSHALALGRVYGVRFHTAVFTNLTLDHLDFHGSMEAYFAAKRLLFEPPAEDPSPEWAVINLDDSYGRRLSPTSRNLLRYGFNEAADVKAAEVRMGFEGLQFRLEHHGEQVEIRSPLVGRINVYNILAAGCAAYSYGLKWPDIAELIAAAPGVPGRFERVDEGQPFLIVLDYAHTDDALRNVIGIARALTKDRVITLFGCGGDRDRTKRPLMAAAAAEASDLVVLTSDNPRSEDPLAIIEDALVGLRPYPTPHVVEPDRASAIRTAIRAAQPGDVVILAGKGHEPYQILKDRTIAFDDRAVAREVLRDMGYRARRSAAPRANL